MSDIRSAARELRRLTALEMIAPSAERRAHLAVLVPEVRRLLDEADPDGRDGVPVRRQDMDPLSASILLEREVERLGL